MRYEDLTIHQRISLKGFIKTWESLVPYYAIWILWDYRRAINCFLDESAINDLEIFN